MSFHPPPESSYKPPAAKGILLTGTHSRCGKTVACAGISGSLSQLGLRTHPVKPLAFLPNVSIRRGHEQAYFDRIIEPVESQDSIVATSPHDLSPVHWQRFTAQCRGRTYPYVLETPGSLASPIRYVQGEVLDSIDLAQALEIPILLVTEKQPELIALMAPIFAYVWHRDAVVIGWLSVEVQPQPPVSDWDSQVLYLNKHFRLPYLGEIAYSPSVSVEALQQGNLLRTTEMGVDLLPIQQALDFRLPSLDRFPG